MYYRPTGTTCIFFGLGSLGLKIVAMSYEMSLCFGIIDLQALSDAIFFGLGNLGLKIVAMF